MPGVGSITWIMLHTFAAKIKEDAYVNNKDSVIDFLRNVCRNYPCASCQRDSELYLAAYRDPLDTKNDFILYLFHLHTAINTRLRKSYFSQDRLKIYERADIHKVFPLFLERYEATDSVKGFLAAHPDWFE